MEREEGGGREKRSLAEKINVLHTSFSQGVICKNKRDRLEVLPSCAAERCGLHLRHHSVFTIFPRGVTQGKLQEREAKLDGIFSFAEVGSRQV